jgi:type VI secretion system secreted protein Hcp
MAFDAFLKIEGIEGDSQDSKHKGEIEVLSFHWNVSHPAAGKPGGVGRAKLTDFQIVKNLDRASPLLFEACCSGDHISDALFTARKAGGDKFEFLKIKLSDVIITSVSPAGTPGSDLPVEQVTFNFAKIEQEYFSQDPTGRPGGSSKSSCSPRISDRDQ